MIFKVPTSYIFLYRPLPGPNILKSNLKTENQKNNLKYTFATWLFVVAAFHWRGDQDTSIWRYIISWEALGFWRLQKQYWEWRKSIKSQIELLQTKTNKRPLDSRPTWQNNSIIHCKNKNIRHCGSSCNVLRLERLTAYVPLLNV